MKIPQNGKLQIADLFVVPVPIYLRHTHKKYIDLVETEFTAADTCLHLLYVMDEFVVHGVPLRPHSEDCNLNCPVCF
jgi:hypothetical protein